VGELIELAGIIVGVILLLALVHPVHRCPGCGGRKVVPHGKGFRPCKRCQATGKAYRRGGVIVQRLVHEHIWPWLRDRINDAVAHRADGGMRDEP
jgi:hypothetical protein